MNNFPGCSAGCYVNRYLLVSYSLNAQTSTKIVTAWWFSCLVNGKKLALNIIYG